MIARIVLSAAVPIFALAIISLTFIVTSHPPALISPRGEASGITAPAYAAKVIVNFGEKYSKNCPKYIEYEAEAKALLLIEIYNVGELESLAEKLYFYLFPESIKMLFPFDPSIGLGQVKRSTLVKNKVNYSGTDFYSYCDSLSLINDLIKNIYVEVENDFQLVAVFNGQSTFNISNHIYYEIFMELRSHFINRDFEKLQSR